MEDVGWPDQKYSKIFPILLLLFIHGPNGTDLKVFAEVASKSNTAFLPFLHVVNYRANQIAELLRLDLLSRQLSPMTPLT